VTTGILLLAGGEAQRLPAKLTLDAGGVPLVVRAFRNAAQANAMEIAVSCKGSFGTEIDAALPGLFVVDHRMGRGPLGGLVSTMARMRSQFVAVFAADAPFLGSWLLEVLHAAQRTGDEAVIPVVPTARGPRLEPLAALYDRFAFLREAADELRDRASVEGVARRLRLRTVALEDASALRSVNTPEEYTAFLRTRT